MIMRGRIILTFLSLLFFFNDFSFANSNLTKLEIALNENDTSRVNVLNDLSQELRRKDPEQAIQYSREAIALASKRNYQEGLALAYYNLGKYLSDTSNFIEGENYLLKSQEIWNDIKSYKNEAKALNYIGIIHSKLGNYSKALTYFLLALELRENINDTKGIASCFNNIGNIYYWQNDYEKAIKYYRKSLEIKRQLNDMRGIANAHNNIGNIYDEKQNWDEALQEYKKSLFLKAEIGDSLGMASSYNNIGTTFLNSGKLDSAFHYSLTAYKLHKNSGDVEGQVNALINIGRIHLNKEEFDEALSSIQQAVRDGENVGVKQELKEAYALLKEIYTYQDNTRKALENYEKYIAYKDSIYNEESENYIAELEVKYQTAKQRSQLLESQKSHKDLQVLWIISTSIGIIILLVAILYGVRSNMKQKTVDLLKGKNQIIKKQNEQFTDSISYASRIQQNALTKESYLSTCFTSHFILYQPKDIVSGDFYWSHKLADGSVIFVGADCTGHGVPGGFMSMIGISLLNEIVIEKKIENIVDILNKLSDGVVKALKQNKDSSTLDGMDMTICKMNPEKTELEIAGARNSAILFRKGVLTEVKTTSRGVGFNPERLRDVKFTKSTIDINPGDMIYLMSDGIYDQIGGPKRKKYLIGRLKKSLEQIHLLEPEKQKDILLKNFHDWKGDMKQLDDLMVFGVKV